jgi:Heavy metal associated domain 2
MKMEDCASSSDAVPRPTQHHVSYSVTYALPGQVVFCVPRISEDAKYLQNLLRLLETQSGVISQEVNSVTGTLVISYQSELTSDMEMRVHLATLLQTADDAEVVTVEPEMEPVTSHNAEVVTVEPVVSPSPTQSEIHPHTIEQPIKIACSIVHAIPGRVRFHVPQVASDPAYVQRLEALLKSDPLVVSERINRKAASVVITYQTKQQLQNVFTTAVSHLINLIQSAGISANAPNSI